MGFCSTLGGSPLIWNAAISKPKPCSVFLTNPNTTSRSIVVGVKPQNGLGGVYKKKPMTIIKADATEQKWVAKGLITESLPNGMFWVRLENGDLVLGYISGKIRRNSIRMLPGDKVKIEVSRYDSTRGRIVYRIGNKDF